MTMKTTAQMTHSRIQGFEDSRIRGFKGLRIRGFKDSRTVGTSVLAAALVLFTQPPSPAADKLIELIPDRAFVALYIQRPQRALPPDMLTPLFEAFSDSKVAAAQLVEAVKRIPGPVLIGAIAPRPGTEDLPDVFVAVELTGPAVDIDELVEKTFLPAIQTLVALPSGHGLQLEKGKTGNRILETPGGDTVFAYAVKGSVAFGATKPQLALRWARGEWPQRRWIGMTGVRKMIGSLPKEVSARVLVNPVPLLQYIEEPKPNSPEELALKVLVPEDALAGAIDLHWERSTLSVRLTVALAEECQGIARVLARPTSSARVLGVFPEDFVAIGRLGWGSAADLVDGAYAISDRFDESISAEYREELAEFQKDTGAKWDTGILGNLVGELAFGVRVDFTRKNPIGWAVVFPLGQADEFRKELDKLVTHFDLEFEDTDVDGVLVRKTVVDEITYRSDVELPATATMLSSGFCLAVAHGLLIVGGDAQTVADIAKQAARGRKAEPAGANLRRCYQELGDPNHLAVMIDIEQLRKKVPILPMAVGPVWAPLLAEGSAGLAVTIEEQVARLDFRWSLKSAGSRARKDPQPTLAGPDGSEAMVTLTRSLAESLAAARRQARQVVSAANLRGVGQALYIYADAHKGAFPPGLEDLLKANSITLKMLASPYDGRGPTSIDEVKRKSYFVYRPGLTTASNPEEVLVAEREPHDDGANFLFQDGHVEWVPEPRASELLELIARGEPEVTK
ncbi:MAG: hypothetical protein JXQ75_02220 [Phycisphaerae bacterium]|nr:hypothetical protein [Phycisphaerae bacterium]